MSVLAATLMCCNFLSCCCNWKLVIGIFSLQDWRLTSCTFTNVLIKEAFSCLSYLDLLVLISCFRHSQKTLQPILYKPISFIVCIRHLHKGCIHLDCCCSERNPYQCLTPHYFTRNIQEVIS